MNTALRLRQQGMTLIELMVAMVLMLLVTVATVALYTVSNQSYRTVDASQELQDTARYTFDIIGQAIRNAGYQDRVGPKSGADDMTDAIFGLGTPIVWPIQGANNATIASPGSTTDFGTSSAGAGSDTLVARFFGSSSAVNVNTGDGFMVDCSGRAIPYPTDSANLGVSAFFVRTVDGEPELQCKSYNPNSTLYGVSSVVRGIESFQVMYGFDSNADIVVDRWVSAQDITAANWGRVISVRVGIVVRGAPGSAQAASPTAADNVLYPLGESFVGTSTEAGMKYTPAADGRLRKAFSTTFFVRNSMR
jgi:type IV pilus assembly protein PilW